MGRLANEESKKNNKLMVFTVGNEEIKLSPSIVKNYLVNGQSDKLTEQEIVYFMHLCKARKLNPFTKEVYLIKYGNQPATMVVSRDALEKRAIKHKEYNGKKVGIYVLRKSDGELIKRDSTIYLGVQSTERTGKIQLQLKSILMNIYRLKVMELLILTGQTDQ